MSPLSAHDGPRPRVAVLDYGIGNLRSAEKALQRVGADAHLTTDPGEVRRARGVVLPGVGAFGRCMQALRLSNLDRVAIDVIDEGIPFLGICVGMQMLFHGSDESPGIDGLGVLEGAVALVPGDVKRPQMQWNQLTVTRPGLPVLAGLDAHDDPPWMYFVHSYAAERTADTIALCDYGGPVVAAVARDNVVATQFHPEKSGEPGLRFLANWVALCR